MVARTFWVIVVLGPWELWRIRQAFRRICNMCNNILLCPLTSQSVLLLLLDSWQTWFSHFCTLGAASVSRALTPLLSRCMPFEAPPNYNSVQYLEDLNSGERGTVVRFSVTQAFVFRCHTLEIFRCMTSAGLQTADCRPQTADCRLQTADCRLQTADRRLQTADRRLQTADRRPQTADHRLQSADCGLRSAVW